MYTICYFLCTILEIFINLVTMYLNNIMFFFCIKYKYMLYKFIIFSYNYIIIKKSIVIFIIKKIVYNSTFDHLLKKIKKHFI